MKKILVRGSNRPLIGEIPINGAKNAILPIMAATMLCNSSITLLNVPDLVDVHYMSTLLKNFGIETNFIYHKSHKSNHALEISCNNIRYNSNRAEIANQLRTSILMLGPMLSRFGKANSLLPGGCNIGERPIDMHIKALRKMGAEIEVKGCNITATAKKRLQGKEIVFEKISVGATENVIMAAVLAEGMTVIHNAATEPEVVNLVEFLNKVGSNISINNNQITIQGVEQLNGCSHSIISDRIEAGTYALAAIITGGALKLQGIDLSHIKCIVNQLTRIGAEIELVENGVMVSRRDDQIKSIDISTNSYPGFPSDMQPQFMSTMCFANGNSEIEENIFDNRFAHVHELKKMGANISLEKNKAIVIGKKELTSTSLNATDLRSAAALILASLTAKGESTIFNPYYLYRGYESMCEKLNMCGAEIFLE